MIFFKALILLFFSFALRAEDRTITLKNKERIEIDKKYYISYFINTPDLRITETPSKYVIENYDLGTKNKGVIVFFRGDGSQDKFSIIPYTESINNRLAGNKLNLSQLSLGYIYAKSSEREFSGKYLNYSFKYDKKKYFNINYSENDLRLQNKFLFANARYESIFLEKKREKEARYVGLPTTTLYNDSIGARYFFNEAFSVNAMQAKRNYNDSNYNLRQYDISYLGKNFLNNNYITQNIDNPDLINYYSNIRWSSKYNFLNLSMGYNPAAQSFVYKIQDSIPINYYFTDKFKLNNISFNRTQIMENFQNLNNEIIDKRDTVSTSANFSYSMKEGSSILYTPGYAETFQENLIYTQSFANQFMYRFDQFGLIYSNTITYSENVFNDYSNGRSNSLIFTHDLKNNFDYYLRTQVSNSQTENTELLTQEQFQNNIYQGGLNYRSLGHTASVQGLIGESANQSTNSLRLGYNYEFDDSFTLQSLVAYNNYQEPGSSTTMNLGLNKLFQQKTLRVGVSGTQQRYFDSDVRQTTVQLNLSKTFTFYNVQAFVKNLIEDKKDIYISFYNDINFNQKKDENENLIPVSYQLYSDKDFIENKAIAGENKVKGVISEKNFTVSVEGYDISEQQFVGMKEGSRSYMIGLTQTDVSSVFIEDLNNPGRKKESVSKVNLIVKCSALGYERKLSATMGFVDVKFPKGADCTVELDTEEILVKKQLSPSVQKLNRPEITFQLELTKELEVVFLADKNNNSTKDEDENDFVGKSVKILGKSYKIDSNSMVVLTDFYPRFLELNQVEYDNKNYTCGNNLIRIPVEEYPSFSRTLIFYCKKNVINKK